MKKNKRKFKLEIPHIHLIADTLILVLGIFLGAFLYAQLAPKPAVNKPSITVQGVSTSEELAFMQTPPTQNPVTSTCGNGVCETGEDFSNCLADCHCGNKVCESQFGETITNCSSDCSNKKGAGSGSGSCTTDSQCSPTGEVCIDGQCIQKLDLRVALDSPIQLKDGRGNLITTTIKGQQLFQFTITPVSADDKTYLPNYIDANNTTVVLVNNHGSVVGELYCVKAIINQASYEKGFNKTNNSDGTQTLTSYCDTLAFDNSQEDLRIRLWPKSASSTTLPLNYAEANSVFAIESTEEFVDFLKFKTENKLTISLTTKHVESTVSNWATFNGELTGAVDSLWFSVDGVDKPIASGSGNGYQWLYSWDTTKEDKTYGNYIIRASLNTIGGVKHENVNFLTLQWAPTVLSNSLTFTVCNWVCGPWSACSKDGLQTRTCNNDNNCPTALGADLVGGVTEQRCNPLCSSDWSCPDWSTIVCPANGVQTRTCTDKNNCTTPKEEVNPDKCQPPQSCTNKLDSCPDGTKWTDCINNNQTRSCDDGCGGTINEKKTCTVSAQACTGINTCPDTISWSACSKEGKQTRSCNDGCSNTITQTRDCLVQPSITYPTANLEISDPQPTITGIAQGGYKVRLHLIDAKGKTTQSPDLIMVPSTNTFSYILPWLLTDGTYKIYMEAFASTGATGIKTEPVSFKILPPEVVMLSPQANQQLIGNVTLTAEVKKGEIYTLDFYRDKVGGYTDYLISKATVQANNKNVWQYIWDTSATDNGEYDIYAKIKDAANVKIYSTNKIRVKINNNIPSLPAPSNPSAEEIKPTTDTDNDGLPDILEKKLGSDPNNPDSNRDGIPDGVSVEQGKSPVGDVTIKPELLKEAQDQVAEFKADEPKYAGVLNKDLQINSIVSVAVEIGREGILIEGKGPPNTILTIYIYSRPIVVTTKTDENGNFSYILEKDIAEGEHEVYVTVTDETGKVQQKGEPFSFFVKKARAVTRDEYFRGDVNVEQKAPSVLKTYIILCLAIVLAVLIGFVVYRIIKGPEKPSQRIRLKEDTGIKSK